MGTTCLLECLKEVFICEFKAISFSSKKLVPEIMGIQFTVICCRDLYLVHLCGSIPYCPKSFFDITIELACSVSADMIQRSLASWNFMLVVYICCGNFDRICLEFTSQGGISLVAAFVFVTMDTLYYVKLQFSSCFWFDKGDDKAFFGFKEPFFDKIIVGSLVFFGPQMESFYCHEDQLGCDSSVSMVTTFTGMDFKYGYLFIFDSFFARTCYPKTVLLRGCAESRSIGESLTLFIAMAVNCDEQPALCPALALVSGYDQFAALGIG